MAQAALTADYVGSGTCQTCHQSEYQRWRASDHFHAMEAASKASVKGNFDNVKVNFHNIETRFFTKDNGYYVSTVGADGMRAEFPVRYTFGHDPLQQYLLELDHGRLQAFNIAWDARSESAGGQRWFHLQPNEDIDVNHPFFWSKYFQNWNSRCADCHSTNVDRNYNADTHAYATTWSEVNVACEACHGPASQHVDLAKAEKLTASNSGFTISLANNNLFQFEADNAIAVNKGGNSRQQMDVCASCHSRRAQIDTISVEKSFHDQFSLSLLTQDLYHTDGQIDDEVFVYGSFLQSKMYAAGVTCTNCHDPHNAELKAPGSGVCLQCHKADVYQAQTHHKHKVDSTGASCVACHMPATTYMQVDDRSDHSFSLPHPSHANKVGAPNACSQCHETWTSDDIEKRYVALFGAEQSQKWVNANYEARRSNVAALREILDATSDKSTAAIRRATLIQQGASFPARATLEKIQELLQDPDPMVRRAAVEAASFLPPDYRLQLLSPLINDGSKSVRMAIANQFIDTVTIATGAKRPAIASLLAEYEFSLQLTQDAPSTQLNLGSLYLAQGDLNKAEQSWQQALIIEPGFVPAMINLADLYRQRGNEEKAAAELNKALQIAPDSADAHHALGLHYVRVGQLEKALPEFEISYSLENSTPRYAYVYAVALDSAQQREKAIQILMDADIRWPNQPDNLMTLVSWMDQSNPDNILPWLSKLSRLMPANEDVKYLIKKYSSP